MLKKRNYTIAIILATLVIALVVLLLVFVLPNGEDDKEHIDTAAPTGTPVPEATPAPTDVPTSENTLPAATGMVFAGDKLSFGLATNGLLSYIGSNEGQAYCYDWNNIVRIDGNSRLTVGLTATSSCVVSSSDTRIANAVSGWNDICDIAVSDSVIYGLTLDGRVRSTDGSTSMLFAISMFAAGSDFLIAIDTDGEIFTVGNAPDTSAWAGHEITAIAAGGSHAVALTADGKLLTTQAQNPFGDIDDIASVFACDDETAVITADGTLYTTCELITEPVSNAVHFSCGFDHALVLLDDGSVIGYGNNDFLQCMVSNWRLRPYITDDGYIFGLSVQEFSPAIQSSVIKTGDSHMLENGSTGIAVILGDISMDGIIDETDLGLLEGYIAGDTQLNELQLQAANIIRDAQRPDSVDSADAEQLIYHLNGFTQIDQYAKSFAYSGEVADAERVNRDAVGYIDLVGTNIQYPLMYGDDFYYHYHNSAGVATSRGSIYLYYPTPTQNIVITGHNLRQAKIMFYELHKIQNQYAPEYDVFANRIWTVNVYGETHYWEVFAMYEEKPDNADNSSQYYNTNYNYTMDALTDEQIAAWIEYQHERTELDYTLYVTPSDQFMTVLTCSDQHWESNLGGRLYFFLRRVDGH